ncbi:GGDEF domain-containing protein [Butyrivibrio proteoclasticus]|uniref:GGDEF domain-containing protein n=1 Tax=Butyrivibrio proteoclasticus TaxID=43305 RepID=UPI00054F4F7A|nr:GGDEF domain-containing protein [Butyrivibrio proteoclasticus]
MGKKSAVTGQKPLKRSIIIFTLGFIVLLCFVLSIITYQTFSRSIYRAYDKRMDDILAYVYSHIDDEDLSECVDTYVESEKFKELFSFMDSIMEDFDIHYLYIIAPSDDANEHLMINIISADTAYGRATDPDGYYLGLALEEVYDEENFNLYYEALLKDDISHFKNFSYWGYDYSATKPLINKYGEHYALLCVDIEVDDVEREIRQFTLVNVILICLLGVLFTLLFIAWMNYNITEPIKRLERSVVTFAKRSHGQKNPDLLEYDDPSIHTRNEVESLSNAVSQMSTDMKIYVKSILDAEGRVEDMKSQVSRMDMVAYQDALTHVKNKAWYDKTQDRVNDDIANGRAKFAILMADLNSLKKINDTFGHEHGNDYIFGACHQICIIFDHSPVFRIGGDEFVVLLENRDYENRDVLYQELVTAFEISSKDDSKPQWERYSAAVGLAVYDKDTDKDMNDVFKRADEIMYQKKLASKMARTD